MVVILGVGVGGGVSVGMGIFIIDEVQGVKCIGVCVIGGTVQINTFDELSVASVYIEIGVNVRARVVTVNLGM